MFIMLYIVLHYLVTVSKWQ